MASANQNAGIAGGQLVNAAQMSVEEMLADRAEIGPLQIRVE